MLSRIFLLFLIAGFEIWVFTNGDDSLDALISGIFNKPNGDDNVTSRGTPKNKTGPSNCTCIPYYLCKQGTIVSDGTGIIDIRVNETESQCDSYLDICCASDQITEPARSTTPRPQHKPQDLGCGRRNPDGVGFQISESTGSNNESQFGEFPWMVALLSETTEQGKTDKVTLYECGGTLIHPQVVLTSANCMVKSSSKKLLIRAGEWDTQTKKEIYPHQDRYVRVIIIHPQFHRNALFYDVALLILGEPVHISENVDIICLPPPELVPESSNCLATGWGKDKFGRDGKYQTIPKKVVLPIVPHAACQKALRKVRLGPYFKLHATFICAGGQKDKDTCKGDGGGPLMCPVFGKTDMYYQAGIVSWGIGCGNPDIPGVYGDVTKFRNWIDEQMRFHKFSMNYVY